jgi:hypothetical protein
MWFDNAPLRILTNKQNWDLLRKNTFGFRSKRLKKPPSPMTVFEARRMAANRIEKTRKDTCT